MWVISNLKFPTSLPKSIFYHVFDSLAVVSVVNGQCLNGKVKQAWIRYNDNNSWHIDDNF